jgi:hypothetical protein
VQVVCDADATTPCHVRLLLYKVKRSSNTQVHHHRCSERTRRSTSAQLCKLVIVNHCHLNSNENKP